MRGAPTVLLVCLLLAGCSFPARESSSDEPDVTRDTSEYQGGVGLALQLVNRGVDPFHVTVVVKTAEGGEAARLQADIEPNATVEKWWSLGDGSYDLDMRYSVRTGARTSSGDDDQRVRLGGECGELTRVGWRFVRINETVGSAFLGRSCASASEAS